MPKKGTIQNYPHTPDFPFAIASARLTCERFPLHDHDVSELVIILDGRGTHVVGREEFLIGAGDVFVLQGPWRHGFKKMDGLSLWNIMYHPMLLNGTDAFLRKIPGYHALFKLEPRFRPQHGFRSRLRLSPSRLLTASQLADRIAREYSERSEGYQAVIQGLFWQLVTFLARQYSGVKTEEGQKLLRIGQGISFLENHYRDPISLQDLADQVHLSVNQMLRVFKEITSESPIQYLLHYRIRKACELLHCSSLKITTIGLEVGFSDSNYFARQFRKIMGKSPQEYRDERLGRK